MAHYLKDNYENLKCMQPFLGTTHGVANAALSTLLVLIGNAHRRFPSYIFCTPVIVPPTAALPFLLFRTIPSIRFSNPFCTIDTTVTSCSYTTVPVAASPHSGLC
jgi:hypothetical protein